MASKTEYENQSSQPHLIITDKVDLDIVSLTRKTRTLAHINPVGSILTLKVESLVVSDKDITESQADFGKTTRQLINASLKMNAAHISPGSEEIEPELEVLDLTGKFKRGIRDLYKLDISEREMKEIVRMQGLQFQNVAPSMLGQIPHVIRESITGLNEYVDKFFRARERDKQQKLDR